MSEQTNVSENFWLQWVMTNTIAWLVGFGILGNLVGGIPFLFGLSFGAILGIAQYLPIEKRVQLDRWVIANIVGWSAGVLIATFVSRTPYAVFNGLSDLIFFILFGAIGGGFSATLNYFLQWHFTHRSFRLLTTFVVSQAVAGLLSGYIVSISVGIATEADFNQRILIAVVGWIVGGAFFGALTAFPMKRVINLQDASV